MPDEELVEGDQTLEEGSEELESTEEESPYTALETKIAALEAAQRQTVNELRSATGRVQSLASQLSRTNNQETETQLRTELAGVSELLGVVTDSIDESILPRDVKRRVADAQAAIRASAADAEINRRIATGVAAAMPQQTQTGIDTNIIEAAAISQIRSLGLDDRDPAFDWNTAAQLLHTQGEAAMWGYFGTVERELLANELPTGGPQRRPRSTAPKPAGTSTNTGDIATQLEAANDAGDLAKGIELLRSMGINP